MTTFKLPSRTSRSKQAKASRRGVIAAIVVLFLCVSLWAGRDAAAQSAVDNTVNSAPETKEKTLRAISAATFRADAVQRALGDYYMSISQPKLAATTYAGGSRQLDQAAMGAYYRAGDLSASAKLYQKTNADSEKLYIKTLLSQDRVGEGCELIAKAGESAGYLQPACDALKDGTVTRLEAYELIALDIPLPAEKTLRAQSAKTAGDWQTLVALRLRAGEGSEAARLANEAAQAFPYDAALAKLQQQLQ